MDRVAWNQFVLEHGPRSGRFLQSWEWGEFQKVVGDPPSRERGEEKVRREEMVDGDEVVGVAQWLERSLSVFGGYAFCPKGPVVRKGTERTEGLKGLKGEMFLRIEPDESLLVGAVKSIDLNPAHTLITDLTADEEELLAGMHPKTRYNIRLAQKKGVDVNVTGVPFASIWKLFEQTSSRGQFRLHRRDYYKAMLESLHDGDCRAFLATASHEGNLLAANVMIDFGDTRTYLHGASSNEHRNLMGPYLLHWELMRDAKARGLTSYDWWGVAPPEPSSIQTSNFQIPTSPHPWAGISRFKRGFGGEEVATPGTYDLILKPWRYRAYQLARKFRRSL